MRRRDPCDRRLGGRGLPPYSAPPLPIPSQFTETLHHKAEHCEVLFGLLKVFVRPAEGGLADEPLWRQRLNSAIAKGEAILAGARDPDSEGDVS